MALAAAAALGLAIALSRFAYQGGSNGLSIAASRGCLLALVLPVLCLLMGRRLNIGFRHWLHCAALGCLMAVMFYGNVASVQYISIGLAALLFYTFPPIVAAIDALLRRSLPKPLTSLSLALAFLGLVLMLGTSLAAVDIRGVALALAASLATACHSVWLMRKLPDVERLPAIAHMAAVAGILLVVIAIWNGNFVLPAGNLGWLGFLGVIVLQALAVPVYIVSITRIGAVKSAMLSNIQPVTSIVAAYVFFGELLTALQFAGGALVLLGIFLMQHADTRHPPSSITAKAN